MAYLFIARVPDILLLNESNHSSSAEILSFCLVILISELRFWSFKYAAPSSHTLVALSVSSIYSAGPAIFFGGFAVEGFRHGFVPAESERRLYHALVQRRRWH